MKKNKDWYIIGGLFFLSIVPVIAGVFRIVKIAAGDGSLENARFLESPVSIVAHIFSVTIYSLIGAIQFAPGMRSRWPRWHRGAGFILVLLGVIVASTGLWMTLFYPVANGDNEIVLIARIAVGLAMLVFIALGVHAIRLRKFDRHGAWMIRTYALAMGAGTQVLTHLPLLFMPTLLSESVRTISMLLGWLINVVAAEWLIFKMKGYV